MVVGNDDVDTIRLQLGDRCVRTRAAIAGQDDRGAGGSRRRHAGARQVVAILETAGDEREGLAAER